MSTEKLPGYTNIDPEVRKQVVQQKLMEEALLRRCKEIVDRYAADGRWASIAKTHFEEGFMALNRALMKPQRLSDDDLKRIQGDQ